MVSDSVHSSSLITLFTLHHLAHKVLFMTAELVCYCS